MDEFKALAERFRRALLCPTDPAGDQLVREASIEAGKALLLAEQAGRIDLPRRNWPEPDPELPHWERAKEQNSLSDAAWLTFCFAAHLEYPNEFPSNPFAMRVLSETKQTRGAMTSIEDWRSRAENFAQICDRIALWAPAQVGVAGDLAPSGPRGAEADLKSWSQPALDAAIAAFRDGPESGYHGTLGRIERATETEKKRAIGEAQKVFGRNAIGRRFSVSSNTMVTKSPVWQAMRRALQLPTREGKGRTKRGFEIVEAEAVAGQDPTGDAVERRETIRLVREHLGTDEADSMAEQIETGQLTPDRALEILNTLTQEA